MTTPAGSGGQPRVSVELSVLGYRLSVLKFQQLPAELTSQGFFFIARTDDELSVVCETGKAPAGALACEEGWRALKVAGPLDFGLVGILANLSSALANAGIALFAVSTYDTDYILIKEDCLPTAIQALRAAGCRCRGDAC